MAVGRRFLPYTRRMASPASPPSRFLYGLSIVLGAFLLFQVQPMAGKAILPWFGGVAAVWISCLLFFQVALLLGYLYAHGLIRFLRPAAQGWVHLALLVAALALLPVNPSASWKPHDAGDPSLRILALLAVSVGLPYVLLSATSPLLQAWFARSHAEALPWRLFALSNLGSLVALLSYPVAIEPFIGVRRQMHLWSAGFAVFVALAGILSWRTARTAAVAGDAGREAPAPSPKRADVLLWILLPACASTLLMAVSSHLSQNWAVPYLWVLPLSLYLLSFILCFDGRVWYRRGTFVPMLFFCLWAVMVLLGPETEASSLWLVLPVFGVGLFVSCMVCHGELARMRPHPAHLTAFYLCISAGGALGGLFVGLLAPRIFSGYWELPIGFGGAILLALVAIWRLPPVRLSPSMFRPVWSVAAFAGVATAVGMGMQVHRTESSYRLMVRDFYGGLRVRDRYGKEGADGVRMLFHGIINHGEQFLDPVRRREPTSYYSPASGAALAITREPRPRNQRVGVIGLGTGTLAAFARPGDEYRFYEISPLVVDLARTQFTYLADSPARVDVLLGDGRLTLEREPDQHFDVLLVDAFSGDAIPVHLLTREAFSLYRRHLNPDGMLAVHITNRYLDLAPVVAQGAADLGWHALLVQALPDETHFWRGSTWVLLSRRSETLALGKRATLVKDLTPEPGRRLWTDDFSDLFRVLK